ncbi:hypothetical protein C0991_005257 [Blastosporella zonata]|nr:hypothetical protein C0991_005257 [Blastosporella zonata]
MALVLAYLYPLQLPLTKDGRNGRGYLQEHPSILLESYIPWRSSQLRCIVGLAFVVYWGIVLFGYDTGGVVNAPYFQSHFGLVDKKHINNVSSNVVSVLQAGAFFGALGSAPISAKIGRRPTLLVFTLVFVVGAILTTVAEGSNGLAEIYSGRVISGIGIGAISAVAPAFVSECAPKEVRGRITGCFQIMESPRWLASVGRRGDAIKTLAYLRKESVTSESVVAEMIEIETAIEEEREAREGLGLREAFFGKGNFIRFVIAFVIFLLQQWAGQNSVKSVIVQLYHLIALADWHSF